MFDREALVLQVCPLAVTIWEVVDALDAPVTAVPVCALGFYAARGIVQALLLLCSSVVVLQPMNPRPLCMYTPEWPDRCG